MDANYLNMTKRIKLSISKGDSSLGYVYLPNHSGKGVSGSVDKQISLFDLIGTYNGPSLYFDFKNEELVGIEIVP
jgi:hypothetical protein